MQLTQTLRIQARRINRDSDGFPEIAVLIAGIGVIEKKLPGGVFLEYRFEEIVETALEMAEMVEAKGGVVVSGEPPFIAHILCTIPLTARDVDAFVEIVLTPIGRERLDIRILRNRRVNIIAGQASTDDISIEGVKEILLLIRQRRSSGAEISLTRKRQKLLRIRHDAHDRLV